MNRMLAFSICAVLLIVILAPAALADNSSSINILLLGTDNFGYQYSGIGENEEMSRADAIYLFSLQPQNNKIRLLSIERDYLAEFPDGLGANKLGTSTYFGGPELTLKAVNDLFDLNIEKYVQIDISKLIDAIDLFGGVDVEILPEELQGVNEFIAGIVIEKVPLLSAGVNHLSGLQAWAFMGMRNHDLNAIESNAERNLRQKRVLAAILEQAGKKDLSTLLSLMNEVLPLVKTNISTADLINLMNKILRMPLDQIEYQRSPKGSYKLKKVNMHRVVVSDDMPSEVEFVHKYLGVE